MPTETVEQLLQREELECLKQARNIRKELEEQMRVLIDKVEDNPGIKTKDRLDVISGLAAIYEKLIRAAELTKKQVPKDDTGNEGSLEEILGR